MWEYAKTKKPLSLTISTGDVSVTFKFLYMIGKAPGPNKHVKAVTIADRRWFWSYGWIGPRRFNWRRRIGYKRPDEFQAPVTSASPVNENVWYAPFSMEKKPDPTLGFDPPPAATAAKGKWTAKKMLQEIFLGVANIEKEHSGHEPKLVFWTLNPEKQLPVENVVIDDPGDMAMQNTLKFVPDHDLYIDRDGKVMINLKTGALEDWLAMDGGMGGFEKVGRGHAELISNALVRPRKIHVLFTREVELRFDFWEPQYSDPQVVDKPFGQLQLNDSKSRMMYNVLPCPDFLFPTQSGQKLVMGTWIEFSEALHAWNQEDKPTGCNLKLDYPLIRKAMVPFMDLWAGFRLIGLYSPRQDWMGRIGAIQAHYRRTFMINQTWLARIQQMKAYRVACVDPENGARSPALVLANHFRVATQKSMRINVLNEQGGSHFDGQVKMGMNVLSYPSNTPNENPGPATQGEPAVKYPIRKEDLETHAPAILTIEDSDQGVISINYHADPYRTYEQVMPGIMSLDGSVDDKGNAALPGPSGDPRELNQPLAFDMLSYNDLTKIPQLLPNHKVCVIFTAIPAATPHHVHEDNLGNVFGPTQNQQLEVITIDPVTDKTHLAPMLSGTSIANGALKECLGPDMYVRISAANEVARIMWRDERYEDIEKIFGFRDGLPDTENLILNRYHSSYELGASLNQIALGQAAKIYGSLVDRYQGDKTSTLSPDAHPIGWVEQITHSVAQDGEVSTRIDFPEDIPQLDLISYLDSGTRELLLKLARPGE